MQPDLSQVPQHGLYHLNLVEAGQLIAKCLWFKGEIKASFDHNHIIDFNDCELTAALNSQAVKFTNRLVKAITTGSLQAALVKPDIEERIQPEASYVEAFTLAAWLEDRGIHLGSAFKDEYLASEAELSERVGQLIQSERFQHNQNRSTGNPETLFLRHELAKLEIELSVLKAAQAKAPPITEKQNTNYLNIIGALLGLLLGESPSGLPYSQFKTQQAVIDGIEANYGPTQGLSVRNLQDKFAQARRAIVSHK